MNNSLDEFLSKFLTTQKGTSNQAVRLRLFAEGLALVQDVAFFVKTPQNSLRSVVAERLSSVVTEDRCIDPISTCTRICQQNKRLQAVALQARDFVAQHVVDDSATYLYPSRKSTHCWTSGCSIGISSGCLVRIRRRFCRALRRRTRSSY